MAYRESFTWMCDWCLSDGLPPGNPVRGEEEEPDGWTYHGQELICASCEKQRECAIRRGEGEDPQRGFAA